MDQQTYIITFDNVSEADADRYASDLRNVILDASPDVEVERRRDDRYTQDFGAALVLLLGAPAVVAIAKATGDWLTRHKSVGISIKTARGEIIGTNLTGKEALKLAELLDPNK